MEPDQPVGAESGKTAPADDPGPRLRVPVRLCEECRKPLFWRERKVHRLACAHKRALRLQRMRRYASGR